MSELTTWPLADDDLKALGATYDMLAQLWLREPSHDRLIRFTEPSLAQAYRSAGGDLTGIEPNGEDRCNISDQVIESLACDYCQLFIGPKNSLALFQSVWSEGRLEGDATRSVRQFAEVLHLDLGQTDQQMPDHLGVQLWIMGQIISRMTEDDLDEQQTDTLTHIATTFFRRHLSWPSEFFGRASRRAETDFYRGLIRVTSGFLSSESATMEA